MERPGGIPGPHHRGPLRRASATATRYAMDTLIGIVVLVSFFALKTWVLPRLGIPT